MQVDLKHVFSNVAKKVSKENKGPDTTQTKKDDHSHLMSFMSIPTFALKSNMVVPTMPKNVEQKTKLHMDNDVEETAKDTKFKVYPQDPLVTKPEIYINKTVAKTGPVNNRVAAVDKSDPAKPDEEGNFIADTKTPQFDRVNSFYYTDKVLTMYQNALGRKINWAFPAEQLSVKSRAGEWMNAAYSRWEQNIGLYYFKNPEKPKETCYTARMADVVTHETGHAVLDGLKPGYIGWGGDGRAIHEGFSDSTAMLVTMMDDKLLDSVLSYTNGDLRKENFISSLAEQFGKVVYGDRYNLRDSINDLKLSDFTSGKEDTEEHNYGRLFAGTFYDLITDCSKQNTKDGNLKQGMIEARDDLLKTLARAMGDYAPPSNPTFKTSALALLQADKLDNNGKYNNILKEVFLKRELLKPRDIEKWEKEQASLPDITLPQSTLSLPIEMETFVNDNKKLLNLSENINYKVTNSYSNNKGENFINLIGERKVKVPGTPYSIMVNDGVALGFDKTGKFFFSAVAEADTSMIEDAVTDAKNELAKLKDNVAKGLKPNVYRLSKDSDVIIREPSFEDPVKKA